MWPAFIAFSVLLLETGIKRLCAERAFSSYETRGRAAMMSGKGNGSKLFAGRVVRLYAHCIKRIQHKAHTHTKHTHKIHTQSTHTQSTHTHKACTKYTQPKQNAQATHTVKAHKAQSLKCKAHKAQQAQTQKQKQKQKQISNIKQKIKNKNKK
jgi:hypothetical protein